MTFQQSRSKALYRRAQELILGGAQTISKQPQRFHAGAFPAYAERAAGCRLWDIDGNEYVDFVMALGPIVLGYCHPAVDDAVSQQLARGMVYTANSPLEVALAEKLSTIIPKAQRMRFFKGGADATSAAVRMARHFTGRETVVSCGYHGWHDWEVAKRNESGVPAALRSLTIDLPYGDVAAARNIFAAGRSELACVIVEPVCLDADPEFLHYVADQTRACGALLVFDEIITGFRLGIGGAQQRFNVAADLATFGKALANGMPLSAVVGRRDIFDAAEELWITSTFGGEALSLAAALATIKELETPGVLERMEKLGDQLREGWDRLLAQHPGVQATTAGIGPLPVLRFASDARQQQDEFMLSMLEQGFLVRRNHYWFVSAAHSGDDIGRALDACGQAMKRIEQGATHPAQWSRA